MKICAARMDDVALVVELERAAIEAPHWPEKTYEAIVEGGAESVRRCLLVAWLDDRLVGFAVGRAAAGEADLESVAVDMEMRCRGVGRALCTAVVRWGREQGAMTMDLEVRAASLGAIHLYESLGFRTVGRRKEYYAEPVDDALCMRLEQAGG
jgi:ribosomal-protein-alanine N-acetyltransferase